MKSKKKKKNHNLGLEGVVLKSKEGLEDLSRTKEHHAYQAGKKKEVKVLSEIKKCKIKTSVLSCITSNQL